MLKRERLQRKKEPLYSNNDGFLNRPIKMAKVEIKGINFTGLLGVLHSNMRHFLICVQNHRHAFALFIFLSVFFLLGL